jgi:hypothetical protein
LADESIEVTEKGKSGWLVGNMAATTSFKDRTLLAVIGDEVKV